MTEEWEDSHEDLAFEMSQAMPVVVLHEKYIHRVKPHDRRVKPGQRLWFHYGDLCIEARVAAVTLDTISGWVNRWYGPERPTPTNDELPLGRRVSLKSGRRSRFFPRLFVVHEFLRTPYRKSPAGRTGLRAPMIT